MTNIDANKKVVTEFIDALFSRGDLSAVDAYLSDDFVNHDPPFGARADREGMRSAGAMFRAAFPDGTASFISSSPKEISSPNTSRPKGPTAER